MLVRTLVAASLIALSLLPARAADPVDAAAAKAEGRVVWYTSTPIENAQKIAGLFEQQTGIKVELFRSGGSAILRRFQQELDAGRVLVDVLTHSEPSAAAVMSEKGLFVPFKPTHFETVLDTAKDAQGRWVGQRLNLLTSYYRSDKLSPAEAPKSWAALTEPRYKGQAVMADPSFTSLLVPILGTITEKLGPDYLDKLRKNEVMIVQGNQQILDTIKRGERLISIAAGESYAADARRDGHPITTLYLEEGVFVIPSPTSVIKGSPNPNAAKLFAAFMLSDAVQQIFPDFGDYSVRTDMPGPKDHPPLAELKVIPIDFQKIETQSAAIKKRFNEAFQ